MSVMFHKHTEASGRDEISKKGKHENSEESAGSEGDVEVTNSSKKEVNSN